MRWRWPRRCWSTRTRTDRRLCRTRARVSEHVETEGRAEMPASSDAMWVIWWTIVQPDGSFQEVIHALIPDTVEDAESLAGAQRELAGQMAEVFIVPLMKKLHVLTTGAA